MAYGKGLSKGNNIISMSAQAKDENMGCHEKKLENATGSSFPNPKQDRFTECKH